LEEKFIRGHNEALQFCLIDFTFFVLPQFIFWSDFAVEHACVENLEDNIQTDKQSKYS
jgi:hypothetical protein